jgi:hypothetical protein
MARTYILALEVTDKDPVDGHEMETATVLLEAKAKSERVARGIAASTALGLWPDSVVQIMAVSRLKANSTPVNMNVAPYAQKTTALYICPDDPKAGGEIIVKDTLDNEIIGVTKVVAQIKAKVHPKKKRTAFEMVTGKKKPSGKKAKKVKAKTTTTKWVKNIGSPLDDESGDSLMQAIGEPGTYHDYLAEAK